MSNPAFPSASPSGLTPEECRAAVGARLQQGEVAIAVVGGANSGKTALCRHLAAGSDERAFSTGLFNPLLAPDDVVLQLLNDFGLVAGPVTQAAQPRESLHAALVKFLRSLRPLGAHAVVVVDDADQVGIDVLNMLVGLARDVGEGNALRLVLVGQPGLTGRLAEPPLNSWPAAGAAWTRLQLAFDDALVPVLPPETPFVASPEPELAAEAEPAGPASASRRLPLLVLALLVVAAAAWWWIGRQPAAPPAAVTAPAAPAAQAPPPAAANRPEPAGSPSASEAANGSAAPSPASSGGANAPSATAAPPAGGPPPASSATPANGAAPAGVTPAPAAPTGAGPQYRITIASFRTAARAEQVTGELKARQIAAWTRVDASGTWNQVMAGPFPSLEAARTVQRQLEGAGFPETQIALLPSEGTAPPAPDSSRSTSPAPTTPATSPR